VTATTDQQIALLRRDLEEMRAIALVLSGRITDLETSNAQLRKKTKLDPAPPVIDVDAVPLKRAAGELGMSVNGVKYHCENGNLKRIEVGSRVFVSRASMDAFLMQNCSARASRGAR
jgi:hypothetical protein